MLAIVLHAAHKRKYQQDVGYNNKIKRLSMVFSQPPMQFFIKESGRGTF